jgi:hypothetical protein
VVFLSSVLLITWRFICLVVFSIFFLPLPKEPNCPLSLLSVS